MTVYEIPNIDHCTVTPRLNGAMYMIVANEGWYIHLDDGVEDTANVWKGAVIISASYDFTKVIIAAEADLPEDVVIMGNNNNDHEAM